MSHARSRWIIQVRDGVEPFETEWRALAGATNSTPFQTFELMRLLRQASDQLSQLVVALALYPNGRPAALFPMMRERRHGLRWLRTDLRPIDYCSPILDPSLKPEEAQDIIRAVLAATPKVDLLYCNRMPGAFDETANILATSPNAARLRLSAWALKLGGREHAEIKAAQSKHFRGNLRRGWQKLSKDCRCEFALKIGKDIKESDIETLQALRAESAHEKGRSNILDDPEWAGFYRAILHGDAAPCLPWLSRLDADGETVAVLFGITDGRRAVALMPASKLGAWKKYMPGLQLIERSIFYFHERGAEYFDLSTGDLPYKRRLGCEEIALYDALFPKTVLGRAYFALWKLKIAIRARMKKIRPHE